MCHRVITSTYNDVKDKIYGQYKANNSVRRKPRRWYEIEVTFERDSRTKFREAFISLDRPMPPYLIEESDINGVGAAKSATTSILSHIKNVIGKRMKTDSRIFTDKEIDSMFEFKELYTIRRFAEIAGVKFDESKFTNRKEFQEYFHKWLKEEKK